METALTGRYSTNRYSTPACHTLTNRHTGLTPGATWPILWPLLCQISNLCPVTACRSDLTLTHFTRTVTGPPWCRAAFLNTAASHLGAAGYGGGSKEILIVICLANDLWSIFRLEPYDWGGSWPFPWMRNEAVVSLAQIAPTAMLNSLQSPPPRLG